MENKILVHVILAALVMYQYDMQTISLRLDHWSIIFFWLISFSKIMFLYLMWDKVVENVTIISILCIKYLLKVECDWKTEINKKTMCQN